MPTARFEFSEGMTIWFWWFMLACDLLIPAIMILTGRMMWKHCPKKINGLLGYRTTRSMKNNDTWRFAHMHSGRLWWRVGWVLLLLSAAVHLPFYHSDPGTIGKFALALEAVQCLVLIASIFPTEHALKKTFRDDGTRREIGGTR